MNRLAGVLCVKLALRPAYAIQTLRPCYTWVIWARITFMQWSLWRGENLEALIDRSGPLQFDLALEVVTQVASSLAAIHKQHLVHRDIKPDNIMVSFEEGRFENVKIIDLGLAKGVVEQGIISTAGTFTETPQYASPEQFGGVGADIRSDLYSLGITLWEMLIGKPPFQGSAAELMYQH
jgi:eukaryotic-like serine/threonine-protein kinase